MWIIYGLLTFLGLFVLYRLVQWFLMAEQLNQEGRDIRAEMDRVAEMKWKEVVDGS
jgi:hypothetical protein